MGIWVYVLGGAVVPLVAILVREIVALRCEAIRRASIQRLLEGSTDDLHLVDRAADGAVVEIIMLRRAVDRDMRDGPTS